METARLFVFFALWTTKQLPFQSFSLNHPADVWSSKKNDLCCLVDKSSTALLFLLSTPSINHSSCRVTGSWCKLADSLCLKCFWHCQRMHITGWSILINHVCQTFLRFLQPRKTTNMEKPTNVLQITAVTNDCFYNWLICGLFLDSLINYLAYEMKVQTKRYSIWFNSKGRDETPSAPISIIN